MDPIKEPQTKLVRIKSFFLEYLSIKAPAYKPQGSVKKVIII